ncbi:hypothetical protein [Azospirillum argentinense]
MKRGSSAMIAQEETLLTVPLTTRIPEARARELPLFRIEPSPEALLLKYSLIIIVGN